jgi:hypothetical protein
MKPPSLTLPQHGEDTVNRTEEHGRHRAPRPSAGQSEGLDRVTGDLNGVTAAQDAVSLAAETTSRR